MRTMDVEFFVGVDDEENWGVAADASDVTSELCGGASHIFRIVMTLPVPEEAVEIKVDLSKAAPSIGVSGIDIKIPD